MNAKLQVVAMLMVGLLAGRDVAAQTVPALINYQGQIQNPNGTVPPTADYELTVNIYDATSGGTLVWGPQKFDGQTGLGLAAKVPVVQGYFNVTLGPADTAGRSLAAAFNGSVRYLELKVGTNPVIQPRQQLLSAPFAIRAENASLLNGADWSSIFGVNSPTGPIPGTKIAAGGIGSNQLANGAVTAAAIANGQITAAKFAPTLAVDALIPPGTIAPYAGDIGLGGTRPVPEGWLLCDGSQRSRATYARLFQAIGEWWGSGDGASTFNLPDMRGLFLRGVDNGSGNDPGVTNRVTGGGRPKNRPGSYQPDGIRNHSHDAPPGNQFVYTAGFAGVLPQTGPGTPIGVASQTGGSSGGVGQEETRPANVYVHYIIKY